MEKKVYLVYASSKGSKDLVYCSVDKADAFAAAARLKAESVRMYPDWTRNFRVYEMPLNGC